MSNPAAAYTPPVDQPPPVATGTPYGGFWIRFAAHVVDGFIISLAIMVLAVMMTFAAYAGGEAGSIVVGLAMVALAPAYHAGFVSSKRMATPGKRLCGLYVTDIEGHRLSFGRALWRHVAALFSYVTFFIGFIMAGVTARKQALHDKLAGTLVHRQPGGAAIVVIVIAVGAVIFIAIIGILAAVAIPAYNDFTSRAKMAGVVSAMSAAKTPIAEYALARGEWPATWEQAGIDPMHGMTQQTRAVVQELRLEAGGVVAAGVRIGSVDGVIRLTPRRATDVIEWTCSASQEIWRFVTASCRR